MFAAAFTAALLIAVPSPRNAPPSAKTLVAAQVEIDGVLTAGLISAQETKAPAGLLQQNQRGSAKSARGPYGAFLALKLSKTDSSLTRWWKGVANKKPERKSVSVITTSNDTEIGRTNYYECVPVSYFKKGAGAETVLGCEVKEKKK